MRTTSAWSFKDIHNKTNKICDSGILNVSGNVCSSYCWSLKHEDACDTPHPKLKLYRFSDPFLREEFFFFTCDKGA